MDIIPAKAGIQKDIKLDPCLRRDDAESGLIYEYKQLKGNTSALEIIHATMPPLKDNEN
jgi:hypothetical protein